MLLFILFIAVVNLALGVGVAIVHSRDWPDSLHLFDWLRMPLQQPPPAEVDAAPAESAAAEPVEETPVEVAEVVEAQQQLILPSGWRERLSEDQIAPHTIWEAVLHLLRLELDLHRNRWAAAEQSLRAAMQTSTDSAAQAAIEPLRAAVAAWLDWLGRFMRDLKDLRPRLEEYDDTIKCLEEMLLDQVSKIETLGAEQEGMLEASDKEVAIRKILREYAAVFEMAHTLRDFVLDQLALHLKATAYSPVPAEWRRDSIAGCPNRLGVDALIAQWLDHDPQRKRLVSAAFIEIDRLGKLNERLGVQQSDQVFKAFARLVEGVVRSDRGDRLARVAGPTLFVLLSDSGVAGAKAAAERIRQTVEAATFQTRREEFTLAANCSVCDFLAEDSVPDLLARLRNGIAEAKRGGRNRTAVDEGQGPVLFDAQPIQVRAQTIQVG